jgi:hypothetical protein
MPRFDIMPYKDKHGNTAEVRYAPMNASESFDVGELIYINTDGEAQTFPRDGTEALISDIGAGALQVGIAAFGPGAASSAARPTDRLNINPKTGVAFATGDMIGYWPVDQGVQFITDVSIASGGSGAGAAPNGADRGVAYFITYENAATPDIGWGVELAAATLGTQVAACIVDVLDSRYRPVSATGDGTYFVFEIKTGA